MVSRSDQEETFDSLDDIQVKKKPRQGAAKSDPASNLDVRALVEDNEEVEYRSEVITLRITPSARAKLEQIWLQKRKKNKKLKEMSVAADILIKVLDQY